MPKLGPGGAVSQSSAKTALWLFGLMAALVVTASDSYAQQTNTNAPAFGVQNNGKGGGSDNGSNGKAKGKNKPTIAERPEVIGSKGSSTSSEKGKPERPGNPNSQDPAEVTALVNKFQTARQEYLAAQKELALQKKDATEEQRAALREKYKEAMERWKEERKQFVEEQKERMKDIKQELHPDLGKVVDGAGGDGGNGRDR